MPLSSDWSASDQVWRNAFEPEYVARSGDGIAPAKEVNVRIKAGRLGKSVSAPALAFEIRNGITHFCSSIFLRTTCVTRRVALTLMSMMLRISPREVSANDTGISCERPTLLTEKYNMNDVRSDREGGPHLGRLCSSQCTVELMRRNPYRTQRQSQ